jgi:RHS repeat-associated protein
MVNSSQSSVASYRYDPYGNTTSSSGSLATANVYRFSSKAIHVNSGMYYYGHRFYDPNLQRWLNRDPLSDLASLPFKLLQKRTIAELSFGPNLYEAMHNAPPDFHDAFGQTAIPYPVVVEWPIGTIIVVALVIVDVIIICDSPPQPKKQRKSCQLTRETQYPFRKSCEYDCGGGITKIKFIARDEDCKEREFFNVP